MVDTIIASIKATNRPTHEISRSFKWSEFVKAAWRWSMFTGILILSGFQTADAEKLVSATPPSAPFPLETVATFDGPMPTGVTVSQSGRIFVCFPRWGDKVKYTVAELKNGQTTAFPDETINQFDENRPADCLISVQSVVVDPADRLWLLDTGSIELGPVIDRGPKLIGIDLQTNKVFKTIHFPADVALKSTYLNDVRFDLGKKQAGVAYITDSSATGPNGIIVVDLESGKSRRLLNDDPSTKAGKNFLPIVEAQPLMNRPKNGESSFMTFGADGIALSRDGQYLYYCPLSSRHLFRIKTEVLLKESSSPRDVSAAVEDLGDRGFASDGLEADVEGHIFLTDYEHNAISQRDSDGNYKTLVSDLTLLWPDTLSMADNGYLYVIVNQLHRQKQFHNGVDWRQTPYALLRIKVSSGPVRLK